MPYFVFPYKIAFLIPFVGGSKNWNLEAWENICAKLGKSQMGADFGID